MGFFVIMLITTVLAIIFAKKWYAWVIYGVGVILTFLAISGTQRKYEAIGIEGATDSLWVVFFIIAIVGGLIVAIRFFKANASKLPRKEKNYYGKLTAANTSATYRCTKCRIHLREEQTRMYNGAPYCNSCFNFVSK